MSPRADLPHRRPGLSFDFAQHPDRFGGPLFTATLGWSSQRLMRQGTDPVEVFLSCDRTSEIADLGRDVGILVSLLLQHGCSFDVMRAAVSRAEPSEPGGRGAPATLAGRLLDEVERVTREEAMELAR